MATLPSANTQVVDAAVAVAGGTDIICVWAPVPQNADCTPRQFGDAAAIYALHGYSEGVEYSALHADQTRKPILFCGLPIAEVGEVTREDTTGNTGTCGTAIVPGGSGILAEHDGLLAVKRGGTVGTSQIILALSLDGGRTTKDIRLGTGTSYADPYHGFTITLESGGTLVADDIVHTWHGTAPRSDAAGWVTARAELAKRLKFFRSILLVGDLNTGVEAAAYLAELNGYKTANDRSIYGRCSIKDRLPQASLVKRTVAMTGNPNVTFAEVSTTGDTITRAAGSWFDDGFAVGMTFAVTGSVSNNVTGVIANLSATVMTLGSTDLVNEGPVGNIMIIGHTTITFAEVSTTGDTVSRSDGSWLADGFRKGDTVTFGATSNGNDVTGAIANLTATLLTFGATDLVNEISTAATCVTGATKAVWMSENEDEFEGIDDEWRIDISAGRKWDKSGWTNWQRRIPASWAASIREYQHDLHIPTWQKKLGPTGGSLEDLDGDIVEWDDRADGGAGSAARFTTFRTWANGPSGPFIALSLTRASDSSLLSRTHNVAVVCLAENTCQLATEAAVGLSLVLNDDGTATSDSLGVIQQDVNAALELALLKPGIEGPRCSKAAWTPSKTDVLNVAEAELTGELSLNLNGTIHKVSTRIRVMSGGQA
jgi:hypothetical protein